MNFTVGLSLVENHYAFSFHIIDDSTGSYVIIIQALHPICDYYQKYSVRFDILYYNSSKWFTNSQQELHSSMQLMHCASSIAMEQPSLRPLFVECIFTIFVRLKLFSTRKSYRIRPATFHSSPSTERSIRVLQYIMNFINVILSCLFRHLSILINYVLRLRILVFSP